MEPDDGKWFTHTDFDWARLEKRVDALEETFERMALSVSPKLREEVKKARKDAAKKQYLVVLDSKVQDTMYVCGECGSRADLDWAYCPHCGSFFYGISVGRFEESRVERSEE